jgi:DtxR family Mn-dependent transcriptional regulator
MPSSTIEDYLKAIFSEQQSEPDKMAKTRNLARSMGVTQGTVTVMMQNMQKHGFILYIPRKGCRLTEKGKKIVVKLIHKHRLIELFLENVLNLDWSEVHREADVLEHSISDRVIKKIDELLNFPERDPHGEIIPRADNPILKSDDIPLSEVSRKGVIKIIRISNQESDFLKSLKQNSIIPGEVFKVVELNPVLKTIVLRNINNKQTVSLSLDAASFIFIKKIERPANQ